MVHSSINISSFFSANPAEEGVTWSFYCTEAKGRQLQYKLLELSTLSEITHYFSLLNSTALSSNQPKDDQDNVSQREFLALDSAQTIYKNAILKSEDGEEFIRIDPKFYAVTQRSTTMSENHHSNLPLFSSSSQFLLK